MKHVCIIAEAGVNHNGDYELAKKMADLAKKAGADYIKYQTFKTEKLVSKQAKKAKYQVDNTGDDGSQLEMLKQLELSQEEFTNLYYYCKKIGIGFLSTPFDFDSIDFLDSLNIDFWKIPSGEITNLPYLRKIAKTGKKIVLSTGMSNIEEIKNAIEILEENGAEEISLLQCCTQYPAPVDEVNLNAMSTIALETGKEVGYSDHTLGIEVSVAAVAMGAVIIEKHFTLDKTMSGPDHSASLDPYELKKMIDSIRNVERALGSYDKVPSSTENSNANVIRKSIVAARDIKKGESITEYDITTKRPGNGISPMLWDEVIGMVANKDYQKDELIIL